MNSVSSWFGNISKQITDFTTIPPDEDPPKEDANPESKEVKEGEEKTEETKNMTTSLSMDSVQTEAILASAKDLGNTLFNWSKSATKTVTDTASTWKAQIEEKTILGDFEAEQRKFIEEKERGALLQSCGEAGVAPWVGFRDESVMKKRILSLSLDTRNFLRDPPGDSSTFDYAAVAPVAAATLQEDPNLRKMRFHLVPKQVTEERFWRNYFYRVSLVKQSAELEVKEEEVSPSTSVSEKSWAPPPDEDEEDEDTTPTKVPHSQNSRCDRCPAKCRGLFHRRGQ